MIPSPFICNYNTLVFDCDGVILDSNQVKTRAFYNSALSWGEIPASKLIDYHVSHGGISRYKKFEYFMRQIIEKEPEGDEIQSMLTAYANEVRKGLRNCTVTPGLKDLRTVVPDSRWLVVSGGDQDELRSVFSERNLTSYFDGGIYGSPESKDAILAREISNNNIKLPAVFLGDSRYDYEAAKRAGLDFIFVSDWSELPDWHTYVKDNDIMTIKCIQDLIC